MAKFAEDWPSRAACKGDPDQMFVQGAEQHIAKRVCVPCDVRLECLADALDNKVEFGVWGGMTERQRRGLLRQHSAVNSWRKLFEAYIERQKGRGPEARKQAVQPQAGAAALFASGDLFRLEPQPVQPESQPPHQFDPRQSGG